MEVPWGLQTRLFWSFKLITYFFFECSRCWSANSLCRSNSKNAPKLLHIKFNQIYYSKSCIKSYIFSWFDFMLAWTFRKNFPTEKRFRIGINLCVINCFTYFSVTKQTKMYLRTLWSFWRLLMSNFSSQSSGGSSQ